MTLSELSFEYIFPATQCLSNLKQVLLAGKMYSNDNSDKVIVLYTYPPYAPEVTTWFVLIQSYLSSTNVLLCPSQRNVAIKLPDWDGVAWPDPAITDYAINHQLGGELSRYVGYHNKAEYEVNNPAGTVYISDAGMKADAQMNPSVSTESPVKPGAYMLGDPQVGDCPGCVTGDNPNWGGPDLRHAGRSNNGFSDGHVESMKPFWYYGSTPWLDPLRGGG